MKKQTLKNMIIHLSLENSIITQFTSFVAVEKRDANELCSADNPNILEIIAQEDVDFLPYMSWEEEPVESDVFFLGDSSDVPTFDEFQGESNALPDFFATKRCETEGFQFRLEEGPDIQERTSQKDAAQGFGVFSANASTTCGLKSNFNFDDDITKPKCPIAVSSSPCKPRVMSYCKTTGSLFGSGLQPEGEAFMTQTNSLPPALPNIGASMSACAPPAPCSLARLSGGMKYDRSCAGNIPNLTVFSSRTRTYSFGKTNTEQQVTHNSPFVRRCKKAKSLAKGMKKMVTGLHGATASEQEFPERPEVL
ncbi:UNVERIFIED_CONTAM: hypothetical protein H355_015645, partial [Colinus virginianus]